MRHYRKLSSQAEAEIDALRSQGVKLSDSDIVAINALCWEIETPSRRVSLAKGRPVQCGNVWLWPLTIHSASWFSEIGAEMDCSEQALAYAMAHRDDELYTVQTSDIIGWFKTIKATLGEIRVAMAYIIDQSKRDELPIKQGQGITIAQLAQFMVDNHGGSFDMWERQCSIDYVFDFIETTNKQDEAEQKRSHNQKMTMILGRFTNSLLWKAKNG